jgi:DNA repair protein RecN (Recombination protein N)
VGLRRIVLRDFVIVSELELDLHNGFTVLTGETGAGKSILIDALQLVTGARADTGVIREGASRTDVSAEFDSPVAALPILQEAGFDGADTLLLRRTVDLTGKSRAWVNGSPATAQQLRALGEQLLDIHGQHAWQSLTRHDAVRALLDAYAKISTQTLATLWSTWRQAQNALSQAQAAQSTLQCDRERLAWQISEVDKLNPQSHEWEDINTQHSRLSHGQALLDAAQESLQLLDSEQGDALTQLNAALQKLQSQSHLEPSFSDPIDALASSVAQVQDTVHTLRAYVRSTELDPQRLAELDARLSQWVALARRYKCAPEDLPVLLTSWKTELQALDTAGDLQALQDQTKIAHAGYLIEAKKVTQARTQAAPRLAQSITQAMQGLGMLGGCFQVVLEPSAQPMQSGLEEVSFLVAGHAGSTPRPVGKVASGGELSRMALAIAVTTSQLGTAQTLIFDEVDAGVGGAVAQTVGRLMKQLGVDRQVLAVTHLPQVAACADHHLVVAKHTTNLQTLSTVATIVGSSRETEIARMLGGDKVSATTLAHAKEMLQAGA